MRFQQTRLWTGISAVVDWACTIACLALVIISFVAVIYRYALNDSLVWSDELTRYLFIWIIFVGASICLRQRSMIAVDIFGTSVKPTTEFILSSLERLAAVAFALLLAIPGWDFVEIGMSNLSPAMEIPMGFAYAAPVVGGALMFFYALFPASVEAPQRDNVVV